MSDLADDATVPVTGADEIATMPGKNGGTLRRGSKPGQQGNGGGATPKKVREAARKMLRARNWGAMTFLKQMLETGTNADKKWATEQLLKYGIGAANVTLDNEGNAMSNTLNIVERDEGVTGDARDIGE